MSTPNREFQVIDVARGGGGTPPTTLNAAGEANLALSREFETAYPERDLRRRTVMWALLALVAAGIDIATMRQIIGARFTDALGNPTTNELVIWGAAMLTLSVFFVIAYLWEQGSALGKTMSGGIYAMLVLFLAVALWPTEAPTLKSMWDTTVAPGVAGGFDAAVPGEGAPLWFLALGICLLACVATMPGMLFILAKSRLAWYMELWRVRGESQKVQAYALEGDRTSEAAAAATAVGVHYNDPVLRQQSVRHVVQTGVLVYQQAVCSSVEDARAQLAGPLAKTPRERDELLARIKAGEALMQQTSNLTV